MNIPQIGIKQRKNRNTNDYTISFREAEAEAMIQIEGFLRKTFGAEVPNSKKGVVAYGLNKLISLLAEKKK